MRLAKWVHAFVLLSVLSASAGAAEVAGTRIDDEINLAGQKLVLNGAGVRYRMIFQVYVAALYLPQKRNNLKDVLALPGPKRVAAVMLREISSDDLGQALLAGIRKNSTPDETRRIGFQLVKMGEIFGKVPKLKKGETFSVDWIPNSGTVVMIDGKPVAEPLPDEAFYAAILKIWLGDNPADSQLKTLMLGQKKDEQPARY